MACAINQAAQVTCDTFSLDRIEEINKGVLAAISTNKFCVLDYSSKKSRCIVRSILGGEVIFLLKNLIMLS